jgi:hypothetical protein
MSARCDRSSFARSVTRPQWQVLGACRENDSGLLLSVSSSSKSRVCDSPQACWRRCERSSATVGARPRVFVRRCVCLSAELKSCSERQRSHTHTHTHTHTLLCGRWRLHRCCCAGVATTVGGGSAVDGSRCLSSAKRGVLQEVFGRRCGCGSTASDDDSELRLLFR